MDELFCGIGDNGFGLSAHRRMLEDTVRIRAFARALDKVVRRRDLVVDAGAGTGILTHLALQKGARQVIAFETGAIRECAQQALNLAYADRMTSWRNVDILDGPIPNLAADVVVCELLGSFGIDEGILRAAARLARNCLRPGGTLIPSGLRLNVCPVGLPAAKRSLRFWRRDMYGLPLTPFRAAWAAQPYLLLNGESVEAMGSWTRLCDLQLGMPVRGHLRWACTVALARRGWVDGFLGSFRATLHEGVFLNGGEPRASTHWEAVFFPLETPFVGRRGGRLHFSLQVGKRPEEGGWKWLSRQL